jgi:phage tail tube protein FII
MKKYFNYLAVALALVLGTTACSNSDADTPEDGLPAASTRNVKLNVIIPETSTYAAAGEEGSYVGQVPILNDATIYFTEGSNATDKVLRKAVFTSADIADLKDQNKGKIVQDVPIRATTYYLVGNTGTAALTKDGGGAAVDVSENETVGKLKEQMFDITAQSNATTDINLFATGKYIPGGSGTTDLKVALKPAVARIEIGEIKNTEDNTFALEAIAINNSYTAISIDSTIYPVATNNKINYAYNAGIWDDFTAYKGGLALTLSGKTGQSSYPAAGAWGFNVVPAQYKDGPIYKGNVMTTKINGDEADYQFGACPLIVIKMTNLAGAADVNKRFLTVTRYKDTSGKTIEFFEAGYVYTIVRLDFTNDDVTAEYPIPGTTAQTDVTVTVTITPWVERRVTPIF